MQGWGQPVLRDSIQPNPSLRHDRAGRSHGGPAPALPQLISN